MSYSGSSEINNRLFTLLTVIERLLSDLFNRPGAVSVFLCSCYKWCLHVFALCAAVIALGLFSPPLSNHWLLLVHSIIYDTCVLLSVNLTMYIFLLYVPHPCIFLFIAPLMCHDFHLPSYLVCFFFFLFLYYSY